MISTSNLNEARKQIQNLKKTNKPPIIVRAQDDEFNRKILENKDVDVFFAPESHNRKDRLKQRDSGLNEILCKLAKENNIKIAIDLNNLKNQDKKDKALLLARIKQNIDLCKRIGTKIVILNSKDNKQEVMSLFLSLGASTKQAKDAIE